MPSPSRTWFVDSIEDGVAAVLEDGIRLLHMPASRLPAATREGDVLRVDGDEGHAGLRITRDEAAAGELRRRAAERLERLAEGDSRPGLDG